MDRPIRKRRKGRDASGRLLVGKWHLEIARVELEDTDDYCPRVLSVDVTGIDYRSGFFNQHIESEYKKGKWIVCEVMNDPEEHPIAWECDECGAEVDVKYKFCPECGQPKEV